MNPMHRDDELARAAGYPAAFIVGMLSAGYLAVSARTCTARRRSGGSGPRSGTLVWRGDVLVATGSVEREWIDDGGQRRVSLALGVVTENGAVAIDGIAELSSRETSGVATAVTRHAHPVLEPPSTRRTSPVTHEAASEQR